MHDLKELRKNLKIYKKKIKERNFDFDSEKFENIDKINRDLIQKKELLEQENFLDSKLFLNTPFQFQAAYYFIEANLFYFSNQWLTTMFIDKFTRTLYSIALNLPQLLYNMSQVSQAN